MKKILFLSRGNGGVNYHRILIPFLNLKKNDSTYEYDYDNEVDYSKRENIENLFKYDIIVFNKTILPDINENLNVLRELKQKNIKTVLDIDDYWELDKTHHMSMYSNLTNDKLLILSNIINADIVTTTNNFLRNKILKYNTNCAILENGYDNNLIHQFKSKWTKSDKVRISYLAGSTHSEDIKLVDGAINLLLSDNQVKDKFIIQNCGFHVKGTRLKRDINKNFYDVLEKLYLPKEEILKQLIEVNFDLTKIKTLPQFIVDEFKDKLVTFVSVEIAPKESPYYEYEKILTSNYKNFSKKYLNFLHEFKNESYSNDEDIYYSRKWSKSVTDYLTFLDETDIVIAPLKSNDFNNSKSNLKMVEAITRKLPFIGSNVLPYSEYGNETNSILVNDSGKKNSDREWYKALKKLILDESLRDELGNNLYNDLSNQFNLTEINKKRINIFENV